MTSELPDWEPPVLDRYALPGGVTATDRGLYGCDLRGAAGAVNLSQEGELLLLQLLLAKYPHGAASAGVLQMNRGVDVGRHRVVRESPS